MINKGLNKFVILIGLLLSISCASPVFAQSKDQNFPTPVTTNEINGTIKARDIGDPRLTGYFYTFNGTQGDIFVNVVTKNFNGDIDIFSVEGLKPLTKIVIYADTSASETGRLIYLRKSEKLLLRVEGRSPNDDPATFRIKFAGSFVAAEAGPETDAPEVPEVKSENDSGVRVNSVGTIIEVKPKPKPTPKVRETIAKVEPPAKKEPEEVKENKETPDETSPEKKDPEGKVRVLVSENIPPPVKKTEAAPKKETNRPGRRPRRTPPKKAEPPPVSETETKPDEAKAEPSTENKPEETTAKPAGRTPRKPKTTAPKPPPAPNPLENIQLVILFKDGKKIERPMSEVLRFSVDKGILTVVLKDGTISRHSILDVEKVTIE
jgi:hypothetical protein